MWENFNGISNMATHWKQKYWLEFQWLFLPDILVSTLFYIILLIFIVDRNHFKLSYLCVEPMSHYFAHVASDNFHAIFLSWRKWQSVRICSIKITRPTIGVVALVCYHILNDILCFSNSKWPSIYTILGPIASFYFYSVYAHWEQ